MANHQLLPVPIATDQRVGIVRATTEVTVDPDTGEMHVGIGAIKAEHIADGAIYLRHLSQEVLKLINAASDTLNKYIQKNDSRVQNVENRVEKLEGDVDDLKKRVVALETSVGKRTDTYTPGSGTNSVWATLNHLLSCCNSVNDSLKALPKIDALGGSVAGIIYTGQYNPANGTVSIQGGTKVPVADLNMFFGTSEPSSSTYANAIRSRSLSDNDVKGL